MATIADLVIKVRADTGAAERDMNSFGGKARRGFGKALVPAVAVLGGLAVAAKKTTDAATALGESQNAVNVVFGKGAPKIAAFAKVADKEAGLSMRQLNELVTPLGASFINMGDSEQAAADKSIALAKRAADMASVFNVDVSEALGAIQAGLRGEADPLERFGVGLSDAAVKGKAMAMGLAKTEKQLTAQDKAQARYALLLEQTNKLQGDFKNTSDSAANSARINAAAQENLSANIGTGLLPVVQMFQKVMGVALTLMAKHPGTVKILAAAFAILAVAVIAVNVAMALAASPILLIIVALVAVGVALALAWQKFETFRNVATAVMQAVTGAAEAVLDFFRNHWKKVAVLLSGPFAPLVLLATDAFGVRSALQGAITGTVSWITGKATAIYNAGKGFGNKLKDGAVDGVTGIGSAVWGVVDNIGSKLGSMGSTVIGWGKDVGSAVKNAAVSGVTGIGNAVWGIVDNIGSTLADKAGAVAEWGSKLGGKLKTAILDALSGIGSAIAGLIRTAVNGVISRLNSILEFTVDPPGPGPKFNFNPPDVPMLATGTRNFAGGLAIVGEQGPELVNLPRGSTVFSNRDSQGLMGGGKGLTVEGDLVIREDMDIDRAASRLMRKLQVEG